MHKKQLNFQKYNFKFFVNPRPSKLKFNKRIQKNPKPLLGIQRAKFDLQVIRFGFPAVTIYIYHIFS